MKRVVGLFMVSMLILAMVAACTPGTTDTPVVPGEAPAGETGTPDLIGGAVLEGAQDEIEVDEDATRGGVFVWTPGGIGPAQFGLPWDPLLGFASVLDVFGARLTSQNPDGSIRLELSERFEVGYDEERGLYYVDHFLRPNLVLHPHILHEAEPIDAELVVWNAGRNLYHNVWPTGMIDVVAMDDLQVRFYWDHLRNGTPSITTQWLTSRMLYEEMGMDFLNDNPISAGPFRVVESVVDSHVFFERFENYWRPGFPYLDAVQLVYLGDVLVQNIALETEGEGRVDVVATSVAEQAGYFQERGYHIMVLPNQTITIVMQNDIPDSPLINPLVRQAISMAIDRESITRALGFGVHIPTLQYAPPLMLGHVHDEPDFGAPAFNPERARELMIEAGFEDGFTTRLFPRPGSVTDSQAVAISNMLADIGITAEIEIMEAAAFTDMRRIDGWDGILICNFISWFAPEDSASVNFEHVPGAPPNWVSLIPSDEMQELILGIRFVGDNEAEAIEFARYVLDHNNLHVIPLWYQGRMHILHPRVQGYTPQDHMLMFYRLWLDMDN